MRTETFTLKNDQYESKTVVLKMIMNEEQVTEIVEEKKRNVFRNLLRKPKSDEIHIHSIKLYYEAILMISGKYMADFYRKAIHPIKVDYNVTDLVLGDGVFTIRKKSNLASKLSRKTSKNYVDLELEEHVFIEEEDEMVFDHHGREIRFPFKISSKTIENYPKPLLEKHKPNVKKPEITNDEAIKKLTTKLKKPLAHDVRDLKEEVVIKEISKIYVPIFEARLIGPKKKVGIMRIDAARNKIL